MSYRFKFKTKRQVKGTLSRLPVASLRFLYEGVRDVKMGSPDLPEPAAECPQNPYMCRSSGPYSLSVTAFLVRHAMLRTTGTRISSKLTHGVTFFQNESIRFGHFACKITKGFIIVYSRNRRIFA
jgi:hypothetical protein